MYLSIVVSDRFFIIKTFFFVYAFIKQNIALLVPLPYIYLLIPSVFFYFDPQDLPSTKLFFLKLHVDQQKSKATVKNQCLWTYKCQPVVWKCLGWPKMCPAVILGLSAKIWEVTMNLILNRYGETDFSRSLCHWHMNVSVCNWNHCITL